MSTRREDAIGELLTRAAAVTALGATVTLVEPLVPDADEITGAALAAGNMVVVPYISDDAAVEGGRENAERFAFSVDLLILIPIALCKGVLKPYQVASRIHAAFYKALVSGSATDRGTLGGKALLVDTPDGYAGPIGLDEGRGVASTAFTCRVQYQHAWGNPEAAP